MLIFILSVLAVSCIALLIFQFIYLRRIVFELTKVEGTLRIAFWDKLVSAKKRFAEEEEKRIADMRHDIKR